MLAISESYKSHSRRNGGRLREPFFEIRKIPFELAARGLVMRERGRTRPRTFGDVFHLQARKERTNAGGAQSRLTERQLHWIAGFLAMTDLSQAAASASGVVTQLKAPIPFPSSIKAVQPNLEHQRSGAES